VHVITFPNLTLPGGGSKPSILLPKLSRSVTPKLDSLRASEIGIVVGTRAEKTRINVTKLTTTIEPNNETLLIETDLHFRVTRRKPPTLVN
jgi:hypothetical protein